MSFEECVFTANEPFEQMRTMDNGGLPFHITHDAEQKTLIIRVIDTKASEEKWNALTEHKCYRESDMIESFENDGYNAIVEQYYVYVPLMVVNYESYWMGKTTGKYNKLPSCLLIHVKDDEYMYIAMDMIRFKCNGEVKEFFSQTNGSSCVYSWVEIGDQVLYLDTQLKIQQYMKSDDARDYVFDLMYKYGIKFQFEYIRKRPCDGN